MADDDTEILSEEEKITCRHKQEKKVLQGRRSFYLKMLFPHMLSTWEKNDAAVDHWLVSVAVNHAAYLLSTVGPYSPTP